MATPALHPGRNQNFHHDRGHYHPGATASTAQLTSALTRHYGYSQARGGKGSHVKLVKPNAPNIHLPGNRPVVSPGVVKQVLEVFGGHPLSRLPDLIAGTLPQPGTHSR